MQNPEDRDASRDSGKGKSKEGETDATSKKQKTEGKDEINKGIEQAIREKTEALTNSAGGGGA